MKPPKPLAPGLEALMNIDPTAHREAARHDPNPQEQLEELEEGEEWVLEGHSCVSQMFKADNRFASQGYGHSVHACIEDVVGRLWLVDTHGRRQTQARYCPFCGYKSLEDTPPERSDAITPADIALTTKDTPTAQWRVYDRKTVIRMSHFQFGSVRVLASNGCHAKVLTHDHVQLTVCVENLEMINGVPCIPKMGDKPEKKDRKLKVDPELLEKYLNFGL